MARQKLCQDCNDKRYCREVYRQLGKTEGPSVVFKAVVAFLLPLMVFIVSLAAFEAILATATPHQFFSYFAFQNFLTKNWCGAKQLQTVLSFLMALLVTFVCILIIRVISRQISKEK